MAFWKWWTVFVLTFFAAAYAQITVGVFNYLIEMDVSRLSLVSICLFLFANGYVSYYSYQVQFYKTKIDEMRLRPLWFCTEALLAIGMIGTMIGFLIVLMTAFENIDVSDAAGMKEIIGYVASGMGVALLTTLTGLITSNILKFQLILLEADNAKI